MNELGAPLKDVTHSCVFDYPDRPVRPVPPTDPDGNPIDTYPYEPSDDWVPPNIDNPADPVPGVDPIPGINPTPGLVTYFDNFWTFSSCFEAFNTDLEHWSWLYGPPPWYLSFGLGNYNGVEYPLWGTLEVPDGLKFVPQELAGPLLLSETGHSMDECFAYLYPLEPGELDPSIYTGAGLYLRYNRIGLDLWELKCFYYAMHFTQIALGDVFDTHISAAEQAPVFSLLAGSEGVILNNEAELYFSGLQLGGVFAQAVTGADKLIPCVSIIIPTNGTFSLRLLA